MSIKLNAQSGGSVALDAPTQTTSSADVTLKLPVADGSAGQVLMTDGSGNLSWTTPSKIIQVVSTTKTDTFSSSTVNQMVDITGLSATITPTSTSSKVLILYDLNMSGSELFFIQLVRGSTNIKIGNSDSGNRIECTAGGDFQSQNADKVSVLAGSFLDSPNTTSATTYKIQGRVYNSGSSFSVNKPNSDTNATYTGRSASTITLMEVAA